MNLRLLFAPLSILALASLAPAADPSYRIEWMVPQGLTKANQGFAINAGGAVAGSTASSTTPNKVYRSTNVGVPTTYALGPSFEGEGLALALNDGGQLAGQVIRSATNSYPTHAYRTGGAGGMATIEDLGLLPGGSYSTGRGINNLGQVAGGADVPAGNVNAFRAFRSGPNGSSGMEDLGTLPGGTASQGLGINDLGQVVGYGYAASASGGNRAFRSSPNGAAVVLTDLGTLGGLQSYGRAINATGMVVGGANIANGVTHAFRSSANGSAVVLTDLNGLGSSSEAYGINAFGDTVGLSGFATGGQGAFVYTDHMINLNLVTVNLDGYLDYAYGINDSGVIVGTGTRNGVVLGYRLVPQAVPEPAMGLALLPALALIRRRLR